MMPSAGKKYHPNTKSSRTEKMNISVFIAFIFKMLQKQRTLFTGTTAFGLQKYGFVSIWHFLFYYFCSLKKVED